MFAMNSRAILKADPSIKGTVRFVGSGDLVYFEADDGRTIRGWRHGFELEKLPEPILVGDRVVYHNSSGRNKHGVVRYVGRYNKTILKFYDERTHMWETEAGEEVEYALVDICGNASWDREPKIATIEISRLDKLP